MAKTIALAPTDVISEAAVSRFSLFRATSTTAEQSRASLKAVARPMPWLAPLTTATDLKSTELTSISKASFAHLISRFRGVFGGFVPNLCCALGAHTRLQWLLFFDIFDRALESNRLPGRIFLRNRHVQRIRVARCKARTTAASWPLWLGLSAFTNVGA